jgi:hypothetical protein
VKHYKKAQLKTLFHGIRPKKLILKRKKSKNNFFQKNKNKKKKKGEFLQCHINNEAS